MSGEHTTYARVRLLLVLAAGVITLSWLWTLFLFPESWRDHYGYNQLTTLILTGALHWVVCVPLTIAYSAGVLGPWLPRLTYAAPVAYLAASPINAPGCLPFFIGPSVAILVAGFLEVRRTVTPAPTPSATGPVSPPSVTPDRRRM